MEYISAYLYGEVPQATVFMALALVIAFVGTVGIGAWVVLHTPERWSAGDPAASAVEASPRPAA